MQVLHTNIYLFSSVQIQIREVYFFTLQILESLIFFCLPVSDLQILKSSIFSYLYLLLPFRHYPKNRQKTVLIFQQHKIKKFMFLAIRYQA